MNTLAQMKVDMQKMGEWANISSEDYNELLAEPIKVDKIGPHLSKVHDVYDKEFQKLLRIWSLLSEEEWNITRSIGKDLTEYQDLRLALSRFRSALMKVKRLKRIPKKTSKKKEKKK